MEGRRVSQSRRLLLALLDTLEYFGFEDAYERVLNDMSEFLLAGIETESYSHYYAIEEGDCRLIYAWCVMLYGDYGISPTAGWLSYDGVRQSAILLNILLSECKKGDD